MKSELIDLNNIKTENHSAAAMGYCFYFKVERKWR